MSLFFKVNCTLGAIEQIINSGFKVFGVFGFSGMSPHLTDRQKVYLGRGLTQAGGKLALFDEYGQEFAPGTIEACVHHGWAEPLFENPINPDWVVCRLTDEGRRVIEAAFEEEVRVNDDDQQEDTT